MQKTRILLCCAALILATVPAARGASGSSAPASTRNTSSATVPANAAPRVGSGTVHPSHVIHPARGLSAAGPAAGPASPGSSAASEAGTATSTGRTGVSQSGPQSSSQSGPQRGPVSPQNAGSASAVTSGSTSLGTPGASSTSGGNPGAGSVSPGSVSPGSVSPGSVSPGSVGPGSVSPSSVSPSSVSPGSVSPGSVSPSSAGPSSSASGSTSGAIPSGGSVGASAGGVVSSPTGAPPGGPGAVSGGGGLVSPSPSGSAGRDKANPAVNLPSILPLSTLIQNPNTPASVQDTWKRTLVRYLTPGADLMTPSARSALHEALDFRVDVETETGFFSVLNIRWEGTWALVTLTPLDPQRRLTDLSEAPLTLDDLLNLLLVKTPQGWEAALEDDPYVQALLNFLPERELSEEARTVLFPVVEGLSAVPSDAGRFRGSLEQRDVERVTPGKSDGKPERRPRNAQQAREVEPTPVPLPMPRPEVRQPETNVSEVLSAAPGVVTYLCNDGSQAVVVVHSSLNQQCQVHVRLSAESVEEAGIHLGDLVIDGQKLGEPFALGDASRGVARPESICGRLHGESLETLPLAPAKREGSLLIQP